MRIEAVTVCVGYGDFLAVTARENQHLLEDWVIVTSPDDIETRDVCQRHSIRYVLSEEFRRGGPFNKARLIQRAIDQVGGKDWILHLDADIVLPRQLRSLLDMAHVNDRVIYGADRCNLVGYQSWLHLKRDKGCWDNHSFGNYLRFEEGATIGSRWCSKLHGYVPIGFFPSSRHASPFVKRTGEGERAGEYAREHRGFAWRRKRRRKGGGEDRPVHRSRAQGELELGIGARRDRQRDLQRGPARRVQGYRRLLRAAVRAPASQCRRPATWAEIGPTGSGASRCANTERSRVASVSWPSPWESASRCGASNERSNAPARISKGRSARRLSGNASAPSPWSRSCRAPGPPPHVAAIAPAERPGPPVAIEAWVRSP